MTTRPSRALTEFARREHRNPILERLLRAEWITLVVASVFVGLFVAIVPAGWGLDDLAHTNRTWQVSEGILQPVEITPNQAYGGPVPVALERYETVMVDDSNAGRVRGVQLWQRKDFVHRAEAEHLGSVVVTDESPTTVANFANAGASTFVAYVPGAIGMWIGRAMHADLGTTLVLAKATNGAVGVLLSFLAVWVVRTRRVRWLVAAIALLPVTVFQSGVLTADTYSNGIALVFVSAVLALVLATRRPSVVLLAATGAAGLGVLAAKPTYLFLVVLAVMIPDRWLGGRLIGAVVKSAYALVVLAVAAVILHLTSGIASAIKEQIVDAAQVDAHAQLVGVLAQPMHGLAVLGRTLTKEGAWWLQSLWGNFGTPEITVIEPFASIVLIGLFIAALQGERLRPSRGVVWLLVGVANLVAIIGTLYLTFNPVGAPTSEGVQGRYFVPLILPLLTGLVALLPIRVRVSDRAMAWMTLGGSTIVLCACAAVWLVALYGVP